MAGSSCAQETSVSGAVAPTITSYMRFCVSILYLWGIWGDFHNFQHQITPYVTVSIFKAFASFAPNRYR
ncbi:hypothetical protein BDZ94DRAFT_1247588 [Collybia nuda]|uniref:Uncharacterized protein n=1 Tax=Collybia nuda TaxID=64659 RepID=A0A9P5YFJ4_9AGAR|nr:hypothetical protein BDZ94DRAFT_1247588 [Collybia nuda]